MSFITKTVKLQPVEELHCALPGVEKIWATGWASSARIPLTIKYCINILFKDGRREEFANEDPQQAWIKAEEWCIEYSKTLNNSTL